MRKPRCSFCKKLFKPRPMGRRPKYCSQVCRQRAYRKRIAKKPLPPLPREILKRDLYQIKDSTARGNAALKVLKELGYEVSLQKREMQQPKKTRDHLKLIKPVE